MLPKLRTTATAIAATLSLGLTMPAPAHAWGEKEQNALAAITAAGIIGTLVYQNNKRRASGPINRAPSYYQPTYQQPTYQQPRYQEPARYQAPASSGLYATPAARAFNGLPAGERRLVQSRLAGWGYYHGGIDGAFGPQTYRAITAYAGDTAGTDQISTVAGAYDFYTQLIR